MHPRLAQAVAASARAAPYAAVVLVALASAFALGAHLSNAQPSEARPFGWEGPSKFTNGVAMVRDDLVVVASLPALVLGARALTGLVPGRDRSAALATTFGVHVAALALATFAATALGTWAADSFTWNAFRVAFAAHALLAVAFYALGFLAAAVVGPRALSPAVTIWIFYVLFYERLVRLTLYRTVGYDAIVGGRFPSWFYAAQAASPLAAYRGVLILGERGFMDYLERLALGGAALPAWVNPWTFGALLLGAWTLVPFALALAAWQWRGRARANAVRDAEPTG